MLSEQPRVVHAKVTLLWKAEGLLRSPVWCTLDINQNMTDGPISILPKGKEAELQPGFTTAAWKKNEVCVQFVEWAFNRIYLQHSEDKPAGISHLDWNFLLKDRKVTVNTFPHMNLRLEMRGKKTFGVNTKKL